MATQNTKRECIHTRSMNDKWRSENVLWEMNLMKIDQKHFANKQTLWQSFFFHHIYGQGTITKFMTLFARNFIVYPLIERENHFSYFFFLPFCSVFCISVCVSIELSSLECLNERSNHFPDTVPYKTIWNAMWCDALQWRIMRCHTHEKRKPHKRQSVNCHIKYEVSDWKKMKRKEQFSSMTCNFPVYVAVGK